MSNLKKKKYVALLLIVTLAIGVITLVSVGKKDKYAGLVNVSNTNIKSKLSGSVGSAALEDNTVNGNSTIEYIVSFTLNEIAGVEERDAIIKGSLTDEEFKYARFKAITGSNIESTLEDNGKGIEVRINNVRLGQEKTIKLKLVIENAPNTVEIHPSIRVGEATGSYTNLNTETLTVQTNSLEGIVKDEKGLLVSNIEVIVRKDGRDIKKAYTNEDGKYVITDLEAGTYELDVDEEIYEARKETVQVSGRSTQNLRVNSVEPYKIETHKYITRLKLIVDGKEQDYTYEDKEKVLETIRRANEIKGEIEYKLVVQNVGEKEGIISRVEDEASEGLSLKEGNNGWEEVDGTYYYRPLEGVTLKKNESREVGLVLNIESTNAAKTYINKMTTKGEIYEKVVYILDGELYKEEQVLEGENIDEPIIGEDFSGWYTDSNRSNKYNFNLPVNKDLILYGFTNVRMCEVKFMDFGSLYNRQEIVCGTKAVKPADPEHEGYEFKKWIDEDDIEFDPETPIDNDVVYYSQNDLINYTITYKGITPEERTTLNNPTSYTIESDSITLNNPQNRVDGDGDESEAFVGWIPKNETTPQVTITIPHGSTGDREYTASFVEIAPDEYTITYDLQGGSLADGVSNPSTYNKKTPTFTLNNPSKEGYRFTGWTGTDLTDKTIDVTVNQGSTGNRSYVATYEAIEYTIEYDLRDGYLEDGVTNPTTYTIESPDITLNNPSKTGYDFTGWTGSNGDNPDANVTIPHGSTGNKSYVANYLIKQFTVRYMHDNEQFASEQVNYNELAQGTSTYPTKTHNVFVAWTLDGTEYDFNTPVTHDLTLYSSFKEVVAPNISHTPTEWTNQYVTVTIGLDGEQYNNYTYYYAVDGGEIHEYTGPFRIEYNCNITAHSVENNVSSVDSLHPITNIDKDAPIIDSLAADYALTTSAKISFSAHDDLSGLKEIKIYKKLASALDYTYEASVNYNPDTTTLQTGEYTFEGLEDNTDYKIKLVAYDYAGNISEDKIIDITTEEAEAIVCRLIGYNNVDYDCEENPSLCKTFPTLKSALEYTGDISESDTRNCLENKCYIQMLESVSESNTIVGGQETKLDLNGKTINGVGEYTFNIASNGNLNVVDNAIFDSEDYNESNHNSIKNDIDKAIINNGTLTLGEGTDGQDVSIYVPVVKGKNTGIDTVNGTFNYYDGRVIGTTAISGEVTDAPVLYSPNVEIKTEDEHTIQVATLRQVADVEARIGTKYYTKVAYAMDDAKNGGWYDILTDDEFIDSFDTIGDYGFVKDGNFLVSENDTTSTTAKIGFVMDLENYDYDQLFSYATTRTANENSGTFYSYSAIDIYEGIDTTGTSIYGANIGLGSIAKDVKLEKGKKYYIQFQHVINSEPYPEEAKLYITDLHMRDYIEEAPSPFDNLPTTTITKNYGFDYDPTTGALKSNNQYTSQTTAFSYYEIDLTNESSNKELIVNATLSAFGSDIGSIYVKTNNDRESDSNYNQSLLTLYGYGSDRPTITGPMSATKTLQAGQKYYVQFYYFKQYSSKEQSAYENAGVTDQFIINSMDVVDVGTSTDLPFASMIQTPGNRGFTVNNSTYANSSDITHSYVPITVNANGPDMYLELDFQSYYDFRIFVTDSPNLPSNLDAFEYQNPTPTTSYTYYGPIYINLNKGTNFVHFYMPASNNGYTYLKTLKIKQGRALNITNDLKKSSGAANGFTSYRYSDPIAAYNNNTGTADSYIELDLRNSDTDVVLSIDQIMPSSGTGYVYLTDGKEAINYGDVDSSNNPINTQLLMKYNYSNNGYYYGTFASSIYYDTNTFNFVVSKGKKYYLHFGNNKESSWYNYYVNKIAIRPVNSYYAKTGKQRYIPQSGSGEQLPEDMVIDENNYNNLRYVGANANNYVSFNGELWRIIGVFNTEDENGIVKPRIKLVRNESLGQLSWDAFDTGMTSEGLDGYNEWSQAKLMKLMNPGYDLEGTNNSLYWNRTSGTCLYYDSTTYSKSSSCDFSSNGLTTASKSMIDKVVWYTSPITPSEYGNVTPYQIYDIERNGTTLGYNLTTESSSWTGYVGLAYMSDYIMASNSYSTYTRNQCMSTPGTMYTTCVGNNSWMRGNGSPFATINPQKNGDSYSGGPLFYQSMATGPNTTPTYQSYQVMPSVYLSTKIEITGGTGTNRNPYTLSLGDSDNSKINDYYGLIPEPEDPGEVVDYETDDYTNVEGAPVYGFEYDLNSGYYISTNASAGASVAGSYIEIDRTTALEDITLKFTYDKDSASYSNGVIIFVPDQYNQNIDVGSYNTYQNYENFTVFDNETVQYKTLSAGRKYYIVLGFKKNGSELPGQHREDMRVKIDGLEITPPTTTVTKYNGQEMRYNEEVDTIQILKNINMPEGLVVEETKDVILDLNGYSLTTYSNDPVITNNGKLTVIDTRDGGSIISSQTNTILNNQTGKLDVQDGEIDVNNSYSGIHNFGEVTLGEDASINIDTSQGSGKGITNLSNGNILDGLGTINGGTGISIDKSSTDSGFSGYTLNNSTLSITTPNPIAIGNLKGNGVIGVSSPYGYLQGSECDVTIYDSEFKNISEDYGLTGNVTVNDSEFERLYVNAGANVTTIVNGSTLDTVENMGNYTTINDSVVETISNGYYDSGSSGGVITINDTRVGTLTNENRATVKGETVVTDGITNMRILTVGEKDGEIDSVYPKIEGPIYAINNNPYSTLETTFNYYDGSLTGNKDSVVKYAINDIEVDSSIVSTIDNDRETYSLTKQYVCQIGNDKYYSIQDAVDSITTSSEVEIDLIVDLIDANKTTVPAGKNIKLDFNGHQVKAYSNSWITNNGTVTIYSSSNAEDSIVYSKTWITNNGTFINDNINVIVDDREVEANFIVNVGTLTMNGGSIKIIYDNTKDNHLYHVLIDNTGTVNINGGMLQSYRLVKNNQNATLNITGGEIYYYYFKKQSMYTVFRYYNEAIINDGEINISGGNFDNLNITSGNRDNRYFFSNNGDINITGGTFAKSLELCNNYGDVLLYGVTDFGVNGIRNQDNSSLTIRDSEINRGTEGFTVNNEGSVVLDNATKTSTGTFTVSGGSISVTDSTLNKVSLQSSSGITVDNSTITKGYISASSNSSITDSTITSNALKSTTNPNSLVYNSGTLVVKNSTLKTSQNRAITNNGTLTLGEKDGNVSDTIPEIEGADSGVYNNTDKTFNFYDGVITGLKNQSVYGNISDVETGYDVISFDIDATRESTILSSSIIIENVDTEQTYSSIQAAIDDAGSGQTLKLLRNYNYISGTASITVPASKTIIFDMNGHNIDNRTSTQFTISNLGTLTIIDGADVSTNYIYNSSDTISTLENSGTLNIGLITVNGTIINNQNATLNTVGSYIKQIDNYGDATISPTVGPTTGITSDIDLINNYSTGQLTTNALLRVKDIENYGQAEINSTTVSKFYNLDHGYVDMKKVLGPVGLSETFRFKNNSEAIIRDGTISITSVLENSAIVTVKGGDFNAFRTENNSELILEGGHVSSERNIPIVNNSTKPVILGIKDGTVSTTIPSIYNFSSGITVDTTPVRGNVKFYDGKVQSSYGSGRKIEGTIVDKEVNHNVVCEDHTEYLVPDNIAINVDTNVEYTDLVEAISQANNGEEIKILRSFISVSDITIPSGKEVSIDLDNKTVYGNTINNITNAGVLTIKKGEMVTNITNTGTFNLTNSGKVRNVTNSGTINVNSGTTGSITNTGTANITLGTINGMTNDGTLVFNSGYLSDLTNNSNATIYSGTIYNIVNTDNILMRDGAIKINSITNRSYIKMQDADITVKVTGVNFSDDMIIYSVIKNLDTLEIDGCTFNLEKTGYSFYNTAFLVSNGYKDTSDYNTSAVLNVSNTDSDMNDEVNFLYSNVGTATFDNVTTKGQIQGGAPSGITSNGALTITNSTIGYTIGSVTTTIEDTTINKSGVSAYFSSGTTNMERTTVNGDIHQNGGTINISDHSVINGDFNTQSTNSTINSYSTINGNSDIYGTLTLNNTASINGSVIVNDRATMNIFEGVTITSTGEYAIDNRGTTIIGTKDGIYNNNSPEITGTTYGIETTGTLKFYDGVIKGTTAVTGLVNEVETNYVIDITVVDGLQNERLKVPGQNERVIMFNNINYTSLQAAVNASVEGVTNEMVLYTDYTLTENIAVPENRTIKLYLNGHNLNYDTYSINVPSSSSFTTDSGVPTGFSGAIYRFFANITGTPVSPKNVIISNMEDGESLSSTESYKLYIFVDDTYKIVTMTEEELGEYSFGGKVEKMYTIKGKLYLNGLDSGTYKLVSDNRRELDFTIEEDGISSNIRENTSSPKAKVVSSSIATLILTFSTGILRTPWLIFIGFIVLAAFFTIVVVKRMEKQVQYQEIDKKNRL